MEMRSNFPGHFIRQKLQFTPVVGLCGLCEKRKSFRVHLHVWFVRFLPLLQKFAWMLASLMSNNCIILHTSKLHNLFPLIIIITIRANEYFPLISFRMTTSEGDNFESTGEQREVHIRFYCDSNKPFGEPTFSERGGNKYFFDFQTSLVCSASAVQCLVSDGGVEYDLSPLGLTSGEVLWLS